MLITQCASDVLYVGDNQVLLKLMHNICHFVQIFLDTINSRLKMSDPQKMSDIPGHLQFQP